MTRVSVDGAFFVLIYLFVFETRPELVQIGFYFFKFIALNFSFYHMFTEKRGKIQIDTCLCRKYKHAVIHTAFRFDSLDSLILLHQSPEV